MVEVSTCRVLAIVFRISLVEIEGEDTLEVGVVLLLMMSWRMNSIRIVEAVSGTHTSADLNVPVRPTTPLLVLDDVESVQREVVVLWIEVLLLLPSQVISPDLAEASHTTLMAKVRSTVEDDDVVVVYIVEA